MNDVDGKKAVEPVTREMLVQGEAGPDEAQAKKPPPGHVERSLTVLDRNMIVGAALAYCAQEANKGKHQHMLVRAKKLLDFDETVEYFAMVNDSVADAQEAWQRAKAKRKLWLDWREGVLKADDLKREYPNCEFELDKEPPKPNPSVPKATPKEMRGYEKTFYLPAKVDAWIETVLRAMVWPKDQIESGITTEEKYGIEDKG